MEDPAETFLFTTNQGLAASAAASVRTVMMRRCPATTTVTRLPCTFELIGTIALPAVTRERPITRPSSMTVTREPVATPVVPTPTTTQADVTGSAVANTMRAGLRGAAEAACAGPARVVRAAAVTRTASVFICELRTGRRRKGPSTLVGSDPRVVHSALATSVA